MIVDGHTLTATRTDYDQATHTRVTGDMGVDSALLVISDPDTSTTETISGTVDVDHWTYRTDTARTSTVTVVGGGTDTGPVPALTTTPSLRVGVHVYPLMFDTYVHRTQWEAELAAMPANVDCVRLGLAWEYLQPASAAWDATAVAYIDGVMAHLAAEGMAVHLTVGTTPPWAGPSSTGPATDPADFGQWVADIATRWGGTVDILGIDPWNEWNTGVLTPAQVVAMMQAAHTALAGAAPLSIGALAFADVFSLAALFDAGLTATDFEQVNFHPYPIDFFGPTETPGWVPPSYPPAEESRWSSVVVGAHQIETVLADHGATGKDLWITEWGAPSNPTERTSPQIRLDDQTAASWHTTALTQASRIDAIKGVLIHEAADVTGGDPGTSWNAAWGLVHAGATVRRPKWDAVAAA